MTEAACCDRCQGTGKVMVTESPNPNKYSTWEQTRCSKCFGSGFITPPSPMADEALTMEMLDELSDVLEREFCFTVWEKPLKKLIAAARKGLEIKK